MTPCPTTPRSAGGNFYTTGDAIVLVPFSYSVNVMAVNNDHFELDDVFLEFKRIPISATSKGGSSSPP